jgi:hypothetical protein
MHTKILSHHNILFGVFKNLGFIDKTCRLNLFKKNLLRYPLLISVKLSKTCATNSGACLVNRR